MYAFIYFFIQLLLYLQTTIEFYINMEERREAKTRGETYKNPFDKGIYLFIYLLLLLLNI